MKWIVAAVAVAAVVCVNAALLSYGGNRNDPAGRLTPIASIPAPAAHAPLAAAHVEDD
jgi:hypothetical protein